MLDDINLDRKENLLNKVLIIDGQAGSGKTLFTQICGSLNNIEHYTYSTELENLCGLFFLKKITKDAVMSMIKIQLDQMIYEMMMGRRVNFRYSDVSGVFKSKNFFEYIKRILSAGDEKIPQVIHEKKPILHILTHNLLGHGEILFETLNDKLIFLEIIRHPLYMIIQQTYNQQNFYNNSGKKRQFHLCFSNNGEESFFWNKDYIKEFKECNPVERAILEINNFYLLTNYIKSKNINYKKNIETIVFEEFVLNPHVIMERLIKKLQTKKSNKTNKILKKNKVPRIKLADSIPLNIYKRCGWQPPIKGLTEKEELNLRMDFVIKNNARKKYVELIQKISYEYEKNYLKNIV